ncbi:AraC family transcriptional regulator [Oleiagrimonas sp. C23AA]|uniref:AraC family transcriptional regulator n=1 Tax=Oleiagrimonas sp. C23AA TaxID=2719047 RepID=UPI001421E595|nr:AraC family transcriptional regulator [Oleiagrimonas sp. C23AA]NII09690.1 AraC family transcriptional regulator [Oleiagrimonas sp. C23AA]
MTDPLTDVVTLLEPSARFSKSVVGAGPWCVHRPDASESFYCVVLEGGCRVLTEGDEALTLRSGDFLLMPASHGTAMASLEDVDTHIDTQPVALGDGHFRIGQQDGPIDLRMQIGHCQFASPDAALLISLLPRRVHIRGDRRLAVLVKLVGEEARAQRPAREMVLTRLLEVLLIEALRSNTPTQASPGLVSGLSDARLAQALRAMHGDPSRRWSMGELARHAALSRSTFFERFSRAVGMAPMAYLLAWRMALAKQLLRRGDAGITEIAERVGYSSASTFSAAFSRHAGMAPTRYAARGNRDAPTPAQATSLSI